MRGWLRRRRARQAHYAERWHRDARPFTRRPARALKERAVWLVGSGPLGGSRGPLRVPKTSRQRVAAAMSKICGCGLITFGNCLAPDGTGFRSGAWPAGEPTIGVTQRMYRWAAAVAEELAEPG